MNPIENPWPGRVVYLSHGGGPLPFLDDPGHNKMNAFMQDLSGRLDAPDAILVISAHWEESIPTVISSNMPALFYDYYGFPQKAYELEYPAPGNPDLASEIQVLLKENAIHSRPDSERGFDHGLFIPMKMIFPEANIPMTQLSLIKGLDPAAHLALGRALRPLIRKKNILVIGSGFSFHNMGEFKFDASSQTDLKNDQFQEWLIDLCTGDHASSERESRLELWENAPSARYCHPREEHLLPLHVCLGLSGGPADLVFDDYILGKRSVAFQW